MGNFIKAIGCAFTSNDMFYNFPYKELKISCKECKEVNGLNNRDVLVKQIFSEHVNMVLEDVIENNVTFELPLTGKKKADIHMNRIQGDGFKNLFKNGKWRDIDFLKSMFSGFLLSLFIYGRLLPRIKPIHVNKRLKDRITELVNNGKQYC